MENKDPFFSKKWSYPGENSFYKVSYKKVLGAQPKHNYNLGIIQNNYTSIYRSEKTATKAKLPSCSLESFHISKKRRTTNTEYAPISPIFKADIETEPSAFTIRYIDDSSISSCCSATSSAGSSVHCCDDSVEQPANVDYSPESLYPRKSPTFNKTCYYCNNIEHWPKPERNHDSVNADKVNVTIVITKSTPSVKSPKTAPAASEIKRAGNILKSVKCDVLKQDMVGQRFDQKIPSEPPSSDEHDASPSTSTQAGCRCVEYSQVPQLSAFQKYAQSKEPATTSKGTAIDKKHNSEQYRREFSTYDGITARGRRQAASMPYRRERPKLAAERMQKIRHKLTPVRDYRLMDTVHYLAQGEFAPRDDGIKLTPSREAVLSDIIWEDVCRTHWPNARIGRRTLDRTTTRYELQRLIDSLLRDRVAHVERRRRRHYRIIKLSNRHENCRNVGKTGDIIVASHKHRNPSKYHEDHNAESLEAKPNARRDHKAAASAMIPERRRETAGCERGHRSCERLSSLEPRCRRRADDASPGPSFIVARTEHRADFPSPVRPSHSKHQYSCGSVKTTMKTPRLVVKKDSRRRYNCKEEADLEHYILLPTLVIKTPSNIRRQKKFSELYHRILQKRDPSCRVASEAVDKLSFSSIETRDFGVNVNLIKSRSTSPTKQKKAVGAVGAVVHGAEVREWARAGSRGVLERAVLAGHGRRLAAQGWPLPPALPALLRRCEALHAAVRSGSLLQLQELLEGEYSRNKLVWCLSEGGAGLLHTAVHYGFVDTARYLVHLYPHLVHQRDAEGRTALHYAAAAGGRRAAELMALLEAAGASRGARDRAGRTPAYYHAARTSLELPATAEQPPHSEQGLVVKRHNIRIWCHDCDMARLQRVVWEGHGSKLLSEVSNQPVVKRFLEAVPYMMNTIRDIHTAVVQNDLEGLMRLTADPFPPQILSSRDTNNMTSMHKAAGLGHVSIMKYIADRFPQGINDVDNDGRTPLHYAAIVKDEQHTFKTLVSLGADESATDNKNRTPGYYVNRPQDIDKSLLKIIPEAPRTPSSAYPNSWDWKILDSEMVADFNKKSRRKKVSSDNSKSNTNTISESEQNKTSLKNSSTQEHIKSLPDLEGNIKLNENGIELYDVISHKDLKSTQNEDKYVEVDNKEENLENQNNEGEPQDKSQQEDELSQDESLAYEDEENQENDDGKANVEETAKSTENEGTQEQNNDNAIENYEKEDYKHEQSSKLSDEIEYKEEKIKEVVSENERGEQNEVRNTTEGLGNENHDNDEPIKLNNKNSELLDVTNENVEAENESGIDTNEGSNTGIQEDDDDVQVQGDTESEYSDTNLKSTAEANTPGSAKRGTDNGRNTQQSLIEGIISAEPEEDSQDASDVQRHEPLQGDILIVDNEIDPEVTELINDANMEMLATLVLNGEGSRLVGRRSGNLELQAFLDNVPIYMQKINKVHIAAREGNIRDLQSALDRRKFAIARDPISPNGATPLHVATMFGKTNIIKYLGGRFPETLSAVDFEGRTALHYAAALPDNGHYFHLLQQLGANSKDLDDNGKSAENYRDEPNLLSYKQLLLDFGISDEAAHQMLSDKDMSNGNNEHMDIPNFVTDEGRYLAKSLGDPLIKGLTEVANIKPKDPVAFLASFLSNFPEHEKPRLETEESNVLVTQEPAEVENEQPPPVHGSGLPRGATAVKSHRPIDIVTVEPQLEISPDAPETAFSSSKRDEHGQSMLHFAAARTHARHALLQLLQESDVSLAYRDELYRTARDVSIQANVKDNTHEIDRFVLHLAARGNTEKIMELVMEGYEHILDVADEEGASVTEVVAQRGDPHMADLLASIPAFEESRESLHEALRRGDSTSARTLLAGEGGATVARARNTFGRTALHVAVLHQHEDLVHHLAHTYPDLLRMGDNLERTPLHYAMGVDKMESLSRVLIRAGAKRVLKDLKGRQPSYYFMNKSEILRLKEEEQA